MKKIELMNQYLSNQAVINFKLHSLHWNVVGINFMAIHNFTEALYNDAFEKLDAVAEQIKILGETPLSTLSDYLKHATIEELPGKDFSAKEVVAYLQEDLKKLKILALEIRGLASDEDDFATANMMEDHVTGYDKNLWFLDSMSK